jgi:hypothetical protein
MLSVTNNTIILSVAMLNVVMLNVVAPFCDDLTHFIRAPLPSIR